MKTGDETAGLKPAEARGIEDARKRHSTWFGAVNSVSIRDNPYMSKHLATLWHNAFYGECRRLGRDI